jgi:hypothetical protein
MLHSKEEWEPHSGANERLIGGLHYNNAIKLADLAGLTWCCTALVARDSLSQQYLHGVLRHHYNKLTSLGAAPHCRSATFSQQS